jgi:adenosylhomocysteine nucleosidase
MPSAPDDGRIDSRPRWHLIAALASELEACKGVELRGAHVVCSGPGSEKAAAAARAATAESSAGLLVWGFAGGLSVAPGTIVLPRAVVAAGRRYATAANWQDRIAAALASGQTVTDGDLYSASGVIDRPRDKRALAERSGAVAVDLEAAAIGRVACERGVPFAVVKIVLDGPEDALPRGVERWVRGDGRSRLAGILMSLSGPDTWMPTVRLLRRYRAANALLRRVALQLAAVDFGRPAASLDAA